MKDKLIILDLDETLIFSSLEKLSIKEDFIVGDYFVYKRPWLDMFLKYVQDNFHLAIWSSSTSDYAQRIVDNIFIAPNFLQFMWARKRCISRIDLDSREQYWVKDLKKVKKLGYELDKVLMIDDSPEKLQRNYGNHILVFPFTGDQGDTELKKLIVFLDKLKDLDSVRAVEKRNWRNSI